MRTGWRVTAAAAAALGGIAIVALTFERGAATARAPEPALRFITGNPGGSFYAFGAALSQALAATAPDSPVTTLLSSGAVMNVEAIQQNRADFGIAFADIAYLASVGQLDEQRAPFDQLRAITAIRLTPVQLLARSSAVTSVRDLRGRRVSVGPRGSGTALTARLILEAFDVTPASVAIETMQFDEAGRLLIEGRLDAMFDNGIYPAEAVARALRAGAHLIPIGGPPVDRLRQTYPFLRMTNVPRGMYSDAASLPTIGVDSLLVCRRDLDEQTVYALTARVFNAFRALSSAEFLDLVEMEQAPATAIPLHEGAARFFREQELLR